jgi:putative oxidoreductase
MKNKILNTVSFLFALLLIMGGLNKFFNFMPMPENMAPALVNDFTAFIEIVWLMPLVGAAEVIGGLLIIIPKTRALGTLVLFPVMVGVILTHIFVDPASLPMGLVLWAIMGWMIYDNREKFKKLI